ncbi:methyltransferase domain-containing protein [Kitasatospora sp. NPDC052896]|uniref:methyltransferase domain-containing protein n=1 Tax=Kitasatospora sp. NPDC052896 TaxID=3364061 RepID=UPI0037C7A901
MTAPATPLEQLTTVDPTWHRVAEAVPREAFPSNAFDELALPMWQRLEVRSGHRVLEIGTGTGYSAALGAHRLGDQNIVSVEADPEAADRAATALRTAGYSPTLVVGDELDGHAGAGPYDRLIATRAVRYLPHRWLHQVKPGGRILATLSGWSHGSGLALLTVTAPGHAAGRFLPDCPNLPLARSHTPPPRRSVTLAPGDQRPSRIDPATLDTWTGAWVAQLGAPSAERTGAGERQILLDVATGSQARTEPDVAGGWTVTQRGPLRLWDQVEHAVLRWRRRGSPRQGEFRITVTPRGQLVRLGAEDGPGWQLPV